MDEESLKLKNQLCFPMYAAAKEIVRKYTPLLEPLGLTYTQYIAMMVFWEEKSINVKTLGERLFLDSGTLTPMLKKMEVQGLVQRQRSATDQRSVIVSITEKGERLKERAVEIPKQITKLLNLKEEEAITLYLLLNKMLDGAQDSANT